MGRDIPLAGHKTTLRERYEQELALAEAQGAFDTLCFNERGTHRGRTQQRIREIRGAWFTPPLAAGVLPGIMRAVLLEDAEFAATERSIESTCWIRPKRCWCAMPCAASSGRSWTETRKVKHLTSHQLREECVLRPCLAGDCDKRGVGTMTVTAHGP